MTPIEALHKIDDTLIEKVFEPIGNACEARFGRSCYWLAKQCGLAATAAITIGQGVLGIDALRHGNWTTAVFMFGGGVMLVWLWFSIVRNWMLTVENTPENVMPHFRITMFQARLMYLPSVALQSWMIFGRGFLLGNRVIACHFLFVELAFYFLACTRRPPRRQVVPKGKEAFQPT